MSNGLIRLFVLTSLCFGAACSPQSDSAQSSLPEDEAAIRALYANWREAVETGSIDGYAGVLDRNVRLMPPGAPDIAGRETYREFLGPVFEMATYEIEPVTDFDIEILGDVALVRYDYVVTLTLKNPDAEVQQGALTDRVNRSKYFDVLRRQDGGGWKVYRHTWNAAP